MVALSHLFNFRSAFRHLRHPPVPKAAPRAGFKGISHFVGYRAVRACGVAAAMHPLDPSG